MSDAAPGPSLRGAVDLSRLVNRGTPAAAGAASGSASAPGAGDQPIVFDATDATFERVLELSSTVPVIVEVIAPGLESALGDAVRSYGGRLALAVVDGSTSPQLVQAFQVQQVPTVAAVVGGRPLSLFVGIPAAEELKQVLDQVLEVGAQNGVTGTLKVADEGAEPAGEPEPEPLPPLHQEAYDAISAGDYPRAIDAYKKALAQNPRDTDATAGLAQVSLLNRLSGADAAAVRSDAAERPGDLEAQLLVADLDMSGGHLDDAFGRLLDLFPTLDADGKTAVRTRILEFFELAGADDPRVSAARQRLMTLLY
ncbi:MAG: tetratricopeptide repeat protein [Microbacteriaceae bacterium]